LHIRNNYLNIYYKGNSLLLLKEAGENRYRVQVHEKFTGDLDFPDLIDEVSTQYFVDHIPMIKENILHYGKSSLEIEYEQMIIRANNYEPRNNSEYFIVDRQYVAGKQGRFDLTGFHWPRQGRRKGQVVPVCLFEVKFALNKEIQDVHEQLNRYYQAIKGEAEAISKEIETIFQQKLELGLFKLRANRLEAMKTLRFTRDIDQFLFILILVDYNPFSKLFHEEKLANLSFIDQIRIFHSGFAMWESKLRPLGDAAT